MIYWGSAGAGILFVCENAVLLTLRSDEVKQPGTWGIPGGSVTEDVHWSPKEQADKKPSLFQFWKGAKKETEEELGSVPRRIKFFDTVTYEDGSFTYVTFLVRVSSHIKDNWQFQLNWENDDVQWFPTDDLPEPLHFGVKHVIKNMPEISG